MGYQFFLGKSVVGWVIAMATMFAQLWMNYLFVQASEVDLSDDRSDLAYTWMCPRDADECEDTGDLSHRGWVALGILLVTHVMKDIINGSKLVVLSGKQRNVIQTRVRFFVGGTLLATLSLFTFYTSIIYNDAIATSDTDIIMNSVAILFISDVDELTFEILHTLNPDWVERISYHAPGKSDNESDEDSEDSSTNLKDLVKQLEQKIQVLDENVEMMMEQNALLVQQNNEMKGKNGGKRRKREKKPARKVRSPVQSSPQDLDTDYIRRQNSAQSSQQESDIDEFRTHNDTPKRSLTSDYDQTRKSSTSDVE